MIKDALLVSRRPEWDGNRSVGFDLVLVDGEFKRPPYRRPPTRGMAPFNLKQTVTNTAGNGNRGEMRHCYSCGVIGEGLVKCMIL